MTSRHILAGLGLLILTGCQSMAGEDMPTLTRTGQVKDVVIREDVSPATLTVNPGDEIRWINRRQGAARVIFLDPVMDMLSCRRNFGGGLMKRTDRHQYTANLNANDSASACFRSGGQVKYVIRADSTVVPSGEMNIPGTIQVAGTGTEEHRISAELRRERDLLRAKSDDFERRLQTSQQDREAAEKSTRQEIARLQKRAGELETQAARIKDLEQRLSERDQQIGTLRQEAADRQATATRAALLADDVASARQRIAALTAELATLGEESAAVKEERGQLAGELKQMRQRLLVEEAEKTRLEQERAAKEAEIARLMRTPEDLTNSLKAEIEKGDVKIRQVRDRLTINMVDRVLFDSGRAQIKPAGLKVLRQVSDILRNVTDKHIRIEGHTDNVPIGIRLRNKFATNWELSTARATSVVRYLSEEGGVDRLMLAAGGYADTQPVEGNDTEAGKAANRRIEIVLYPKELAEVARQGP